MPIQWNRIARAGSALLAAGLIAGPSFAYAKGTVHKPTGTATPPFKIHTNATATYQNGYTPSQIRTAYGLSQLPNDGQGITVAIVDAYGSPSIQKDLKTFDSQFGLPSASLTIAQTGKIHRNSGWALETSLDVEWVHALAPAAHILLVETPSASISNLLNGIQYATSHGANVVSNSWGGSEFSSEGSYNSYFQHSGVVYTASAGDSGAGTEWPAVSPDVLGVGGTTLNTTTNGSYVSESAWSSSGGGTSTYLSRPTYQNNWINVVGNQRGVPDIAWDANPNTGVAIYDSTKYQGQSGWFVVGGTSVGAPSWAAMVALADQGRAANGSPLLSSGSNHNILTDLYNLAGTTNSTGYTTNFHDITKGSNGNPAQPGYDLVTGIGSPKANNLIPNLVSAP